MTRLRSWRWMVAGIVASGALMAAEDEAGRGVARVSLIQGDVSVRRGDSGEWVAAAPNAPLVVEDRVLSGAGSKAEVQLDYANFLRLGENAEIRLSQLEYGRYQVQLAQGTITMRVLRDSEAETEISTPSIAIRPVKKGAYRISVRADGTTELAVRSGEVEVFTPQGTERVKSGRTMLARGSAAEAEFQVSEALPRDEWDEWNERRDRDLERSKSYNYVSTSVYGAEDLDNHGDWVYDAPYGYVWTPRVAVGWSPYRHGRWAWVDWYGWSWVSYDPWGWAPYHYGRWYNGPRGWCWWPGAVRSRHYWSPGLVAWVGFGGGGVNVGVGFGRVGWIPLAPYEPYHRWYGRDYYRGYRNGNYNNVTVVNNVNITNVYRNSRVSNGVTAVDSGDFRTGRYNAARLSDADFRGASLVRGQLPVTPDRANLRFSDRDAAGSPRSSDSGRFFSRRSPAAVDRVSFDDQRRGVDEVRRRTFGETGGGVAAQADRGSRRDVAEDGSRGWRRVGETRAPGAEGRSGDVRGGETRGSEPAAGRSRDRSNTDGNWRRFGSPGGTSRSSGLSNESGAEPAARGRDRGNTDSNWRRFGSPRGESGGSADSDRGSGWRTGDRAPASRGESPRESPRQRMESAPRMETPREPAASPRGGGRSREQGWRQFDSTGGGSESVRVRPPIVRDRSSSGNRGNFGGLDNGGGISRGGSDRPSRMEGFGGTRGGGSRPAMESGGSRGGGGFGGARGGGDSGGGARSGGGSRGGEGSPRGGRGR